MIITIVTVCFNSAKTIESTLSSVATQTFPRIEHLIIDGGSTDGTIEIVQNWKSHNLTLLSSPDRGIYDAMNKGIKLATGNIIGFINSDDFYASSDVLAEVASVFEDSSIDCCYGDLCYVNEVSSEKVVRYWRSGFFVPNSFRRGWCPPHPTFFARRIAYEKFGRFDLSFKLAADFELMARFLEKHRLKSFYIPKVLIHMRLGGATNKNIRNIYKQNNEIFQSLRKLGLKPSFFYLFSNKFFSKFSQYFGKPSR